MQTLTVVEHLDVVGNSCTGVAAGREHRPVDQLVLQRREERFGHSIVPAHPGPPDGTPQPVSLERIKKLGGGVLLRFKGW